MSRTVSFWVRPREGEPWEKLPAVYDEDEFRFMQRLASKAISAPAGSQERQEGMNEVLTLHEAKALFEGSRILIEPDASYRPSQDSLFQIPDKALHELGGQQLPFDG